MTTLHAGLPFPARFLGDTLYTASKHRYYVQRMAAPRDPEAPPYKGTPDERFWYVVGGAVGILHLLLIGTCLILSGMIPSNDICASSSIRTWTYWSLYGDKGLTILALGWFYSLLWHTLWRWWYGPAFIFAILCGALHTFCAVWYAYFPPCSSFFSLPPSICTQIDALNKITKSAHTC